MTEQAHRNFHAQPLDDYNFTGERLDGADFSAAHLTCACFAGANLVGANLAGATLVYADLRDALLYGANLRGANCIGANLSGALLDDTTDLTGIRLEKAHVDPGSRLDEAQQQERERLRSEVLQQRLATLPTPEPHTRTVPLPRGHLISQRQREVDTYEEEGP